MGLEVQAHVVTLRRAQTESRLSMPMLRSFPPKRLAHSAELDHRPEAETETETGTESDRSSISVHKFDCNVDLTLEQLQHRPRRNSVPASFLYGGHVHDANAIVVRPRSFDSWGPASSAKWASLSVLEARIREEEMAVHSHREQANAMRRRSASDLLRSMATLFSPNKKEASHLRCMQIATEAAKSHRSLTVLNDIRTLVLMTEDSEFAATPRASLVDAAIQRLLDGAVSADDVLSEDSMHHVLALQANWLQHSAESHQQSESRHHLLRHRGARLQSSAGIALQSFLHRLDRRNRNDKHLVPLALDRPTEVLLEFEHLISRHRLIKPKVKRAFDRLCRDTMTMFTPSRDSTTSLDAVDPCIAELWKTRASNDVLWCIIDEIVDSIFEEAWINDNYRPTLALLVEQMVFGRLAAVCYRDQALELDELNTQWREQVVDARKLQLKDLGLDSAANTTAIDAAFVQSIAAFNALPYLVPSSVVASFLDAIRILYREAEQALGRSVGCMSADVILPVLVFVLSRCTLPHVHSQIFIMEQFASKTQEGSEAAYYLATLQAAVGYIMALEPQA